MRATSAAFWVLALVCAGCDKPLPQTGVASGAAGLEPERTEVVFADGYAKLFLAECRKATPTFPKGSCERLLYAERAKQVWSAEVYADAHAKPLDTTAPNTEKWQVFVRPPREEILNAVPFVPTPAFANESWVRLADLRNLSEQQADAIEAAMTRTKHIKWEDLKK